MTWRLYATVASRASRYKRTSYNWNKIWISVPENIFSTRVSRCRMWATLKAHCADGSSLQPLVLQFSVCVYVCVGACLSPEERRARRVVVQGMDGWHIGGLWRGGGMRVTFPASWLDAPRWRVWGGRPSRKKGSTWPHGLSGEAREHDRTFRLHTHGDICQMALGYKSGCQSSCHMMKPFCILRLLIQ